MPVITLNVDKLGKANTKYGSFKSGDDYWSYPIGVMNPKEGTRVTVEYEDNVKDGKTYHNISKEVQTQAMPSGAAPSDGRYDTKDRVISRLSIAKSCIEAGVKDLRIAQRWLDWCEGRYKIDLSAPSAPPSATRRPSQPTHPDPDDFNQDHGDQYLDDEVPF